MKKCPTCEKTFDDAMRFCQTCGTPLIEVLEEVQDDPLKTTVVRQEDFASAIPSAKPLEANSPRKEDSGDLLQLPEDFGSMKTVVSNDEPNLELDLNKPKEVSETPKIQNVPPEPPKFSEPSLSPPNFSDLSSPQTFDEPKLEEEPPPTAIYSSEPGPFSSEISSSQPPPSPFENFEKPPFERQVEKPASPPIPSPFDSPKPVNRSFQEPEPISPIGSPFESPSSFGGGQMVEQQNQGFNQPVQNADWNPPPAPNPSWQDQGVGANTPLQPPAIGTGQDQTMAIVSLVCGFASLLICQLLGPVALFTGYTARKNAKSNPQQYGGEGLALAGMILGGIGTVFLILVILYFLFAFVFVASRSF